MRLRPCLTIFAFVWEWIVQLTKMFSSGLPSIIAEMHLRHGGRGKRAESFLPNTFGSSSRSLTSHPQNDKVSGPSLQLLTNIDPHSPSVTDMLQTAKQFARRYQLDGGKTHLDGLTFGEFCILLADLRGFR